MIQIVAAHQVLIRLTLTAVRGHIESGNGLEQLARSKDGQQRSSSFTTTPSLAVLAMPISFNLSAVTVMLTSSLLEPSDGLADAPAGAVAVGEAPGSAAAGRCGLSINAPVSKRHLIARPKRR